MRVRLRTSKMSIEIPKAESEAWIHITVQQVIEDDNGGVLNIVPRYDYISKPLSEIITQITNYPDPVLGTVGSISGGGMASALTILVSQWIKDEHSGTILDDGSIIVSSQ